MKAATVAVQTMEHPMYAHEDFEPDHTSSPTDTMIQDLQLYGYRPAAGEADPRITPEDHVIQTAVADIFDALISTMADTSLDFDLDDRVWDRLGESEQHPQNALWRLLDRHSVPRGTVRPWFRPERPAAEAARGRARQRRA